MKKRFILSLLLSVAMSASSSAFAPAPVYREPPIPRVPEILSAIQGTWDYDSNVGLVVRGGLKQTTHVRIEDNTWTYITITNGVVREGAKFEIVLDTKQNPPTLDLRHRAEVNQIPLPGDRAGQLALKGIVKVEGGTLTYCYVSGGNQNSPRPRQFEGNRAMPNNNRGSTMTFQRTVVTTDW